MKTPTPVLVVIVAFLSAARAFAQSEPYVLGADISWIPEREAGGVRYAHNGQVRDVLDILKEHKFNYIRLRLFVDPAAKIPNESESPYSAKGYCGIDSTIKMAKRVKAAGMKFLLDFHYSDTWADPAKQYKPLSWEGLNFAQLTEKVRSYTKETLERFKDNGALPDMVQVGNEIVGGMIWPDGRSSNMSNFAALMNAGINGVKDVDANIKIMVHTINERNPNGWLTGLKNAGVTRIDVFGLSYYSEWHGTPDSLERVVKAVANSNGNNSIKIAVAEYADNHRRVNDIIFNLPENKRFGTFVWEPCDWKEALFDWKNNRRETNGRIALYPVMAEAYGLTGGNTSIRAGAAPVRSAGKAGGNSIARGKNAVRITAERGAVFEVFDLTGKRVSAPLRLQGGVHSVSLGHLPKGAYVAKVSFHDGNYKNLILNRALIYITQSTNASK
jgi:arabinogalactan endo-1,4-beta-galactosidase